jgi:hypothetical protein
LQNISSVQVVIATGTLAYGIHMPCQSMVMAGDSPFLDTLNFTLACCHCLLLLLLLLL